jgi:hypothetical protein
MIRRQSKQIDLLFNPIDNYIGNFDFSVIMILEEMQTLFASYLSYCHQVTMFSSFSSSCLSLHRFVRVRLFRLCTRMCSLSNSGPLSILFLSLCNSFMALLSIGYISRRILASIDIHGTRCWSSSNYT